jgi:hypothetical protein
MILRKIYNYIYLYIGRTLYKKPNIRKYLPDKMYLQNYWKERMGYYMDFDHPQTFNEKLQWLKLYDRNPQYTVMADKVAVKDYVSNLIGMEHIIPTLGVYDNFDEIDFNTLPEQFVIKCSHDSGSVVVCKDKAALDVDKIRESFTKSLKSNWYEIGKEWAYKNVQPKIIIEQYMQDCRQDSLTDYKFYSFNGEPKFLYVSYNLSDHENAFINYLTIDWQSTPFHRQDYKENPNLPVKPKHYDQMVKFCRLLSKNIPFVRVDFYEINSIVYFSELTFYPGCGMTPFIPNEWDNKVGEYITVV